MKAQSNVYVELQNIYKTKARKDVQEVLDLVHAQEKGKTIEYSEVENFCKNAAFIKLIRSSTPDSDLQKVASRCIPCLLSLAAN
jgi:amyloid beta precursor protein binding protein 1